MPLTIEAVQAALATVEDPELHRSLMDLGMVRDIELSDGAAVSLTIDLTTPACPLKAEIHAAVVEAVGAAGARKVNVKWGVRMPTREIPEGDPCPQVKSIILIVSGKGGVGKSTVAANLALSLQRAGCRVGLLDADMYGPSIPTMLGVTGPLTASASGGIEPRQRFGVKLMSIGFLLEDDKQAVIWRGPMLHSMVQQFLRGVSWGQLDYLIIDLPPGTGDIALTLSQKVRLSGAVIVTTPQDVALSDVYKAVAMMQKVRIDILGVVENESFFLCDGCGKRHELFGSGGGAKVAELAGAPLLGQIPIDPAIRRAGDDGVPVAQALPDSASAVVFQQIADKLAARVSVLSASPKQGPREAEQSSRHLPIGGYPQS